MARWVRVVILVMALVSTCSAQDKKRVAIMDFEYATVQGGVAAIFGTNVDVGKGIADILVTDLVKSGVYSVIERKALEKILAEQNFSNSDRADPTSAAKLARILGVDAMVIGSITQFGRDDKSTSVGGGGFGRVFGLGGASKREAKAVVAINARIISTETAEILAVAEGKGESKRSGTSLIGAGAGAGGGGVGAFDMSSSNFADTILGEAVHQAVDSVAQQLDQNAGKLPTHTVKVEGLVADVAGGTLILNVGSKAGVKVGDQLDVRRVSREIKDPATGRVLRRMTEKVGTVTITEVDEASAVGTYTGDKPANVGDAVQTP